MEARQAGLGPKDGWVVTPQKLLIHLLVLLLQGAGRTRETWKVRSEKLLGILQQLASEPVPRMVATGAQRGRTMAHTAELPSHLASHKTW